MSEYCNQQLAVDHELSSTSPQQTGHYYTAPRHTAAMSSTFGGHQTTWSSSAPEQNLSECDETYDKIIDFSKSSVDHTTVMNKPMEDYEVYLPMDARPDLPQLGGDNVNVLKKRPALGKKTARKSLKNVVLVVGICLALCTLLSLTALGLGALNLARAQSLRRGTNAYMQVGAQQANNTEDILAQIRTLEKSIVQMQERLNATSTQLNSTVAAFNTRVNLYSGCYRHSVRCQVVQHPQNRYIYLCNTPYLPLNMTVSY